MRKLSIISATIILLFLCNKLSIFAAEPLRTPFIVLTVNDKVYQPEQEIPVCPGEKITIKAILMGGKRDYCMYPEKYSNVGKNVVIESKGENGMSFYINEGQFRGVWTLKKEVAQYKSDAAVKITMLDAMVNIQTEVVVEVPKSGFSKIFLNSGEVLQEEATIDVSYSNNSLKIENYDKPDKSITIKIKSIEKNGANIILYADDSNIETVTIDGVNKNQVTVWYKDGNTLTLF